MGSQRARDHISVSFNLSIPDSALTSIPWMHGCEVIVGNWDVNLGRGRQLHRGRIPGAVTAAKKRDSLMELCQFNNMAHAALEAAECMSPLPDSLGDITASPRHSAPILSAAQSSSGEYSVDTPPTVYSIPAHHEPGMGYAGWKEFSGRSRAPSPWVAGYWSNHPATPGRVRRFVRRAKDSFKASRLGSFISRVAQSRSSSEKL
jgi:hypothetical protein